MKPASVLPGDIFRNGNRVVYVHRIERGWVYYAKTEANREAGLNDLFKTPRKEFVKAIRESGATLTRIMRMK